MKSSQDLTTDLDFSLYECQPVIMSVSMQNEGSIISYEKGVVRTPVVTLAVCRNNLSSSLAMLGGC